MLNMLSKGLEFLENFAWEWGPISHFWIYLS